MPRYSSALLAAFVPAFAAAQTPQIEHFEKAVRPLLLKHCASCHGEAGKKIKGGLDLSTRAKLLEGGESGPAVVPGDAKKSLLIEAVRYDGDLKMPPKGKLSAAEIAALTAWVTDGAVWPEAAAAKVAEKAKGPLFTAEQKQFWAWQPVKAWPVPKDSANPIDAFHRAKLREAGLQPAPPATKPALLRRVTYDLTGLPPTPEELDAFLEDDAPTAFEKVVDRLLASPAYGERWGRHWLDVARYADTNGLDENTIFHNAWRYRDYVIAAFNDDLPFDQFVTEQLAGDLLPKADAATTRRRLVATGFLVIGAKLLAEPDKEKMTMDIVDEQIDTVSKAFLGLTLSCARCHDHKFDPLPTRDYYGLAGVFRSTKTMATLATVAKAHERNLGGADDEKKAEAWRQRVARAEKDRNLIRGSKSATFAAVGGALGLAGAGAAINDFVGALKKNPPPVPLALAVQDADKPAAVKVHVRGSHTALGEPAPRIFPRILAGEMQAEVPGNQSGRLQLAAWVTDPKNPLTARVWVNRVWQHHFGEGIVRSPDNFGKLGDRPTHPELLDTLAASFVSDGWSTKKLHRRILLSDAYRMSTRFDDRAATADPDNKLLWRYPRRRLEAEAIRDGILSVAGTLDRTAGGLTVNGGSFAYVSTQDYTPKRRAVYLPVVRGNTYDFFQTFDFAEPSVPNGRRDTTVVAPQALFLMNSPLVAEAAAAFAGRLAKAGSDPAHRVRSAYRLAFGREATPEEVAAAVTFVSASGGTPAAWAGWCKVLFAANEFVYLD